MSNDRVDASAGDATPDAETLALIRGEIAQAIADPYPAFARKVWSIGKAA